MCSIKKEEMMIYSFFHCFLFIYMANFRTFSTNEKWIYDYYHNSNNLYHSSSTWESLPKVKGKEGNQSLQKKAAAKLYTTHLYLRFASLFVFVCLFVSIRVCLLSCLVLSCIFRSNFDCFFVLLSLLHLFWTGFWNRTADFVWKLINWCYFFKLTSCCGLRGGWRWWGWITWRVS